MLLAGGAVRRLSERHGQLARQGRSRTPHRQLRLTDDPAAPSIDLALIEAVEGPIGLAVSGGGDSVALAVRLCEALPDRTFTILTVDHGLRPEAAEECRFVATLAARLGRPCRILSVEGGPTGSLMAWARDARYDSLATAARTLGLAAIATGHTLDDQAETVLLRIARGSGLKGLSAMRPDTLHHGVRILRPLLGTRRESLRAWLAGRGIAWRDDPSNEDPRFDRIAIRNLMPALADAGIAPERLAAVAGHLARAADLVDREAERLVATAVHRCRTGAAQIATDRWFAAHAEIRLRAFAEVVRRVGGLPVPPRFGTLAEADAALRRGAPATLGRCRAVPAQGKLLIWRENRGLVPVRVAPGESAVFDGRYSIVVPSGCRPVEVGSAGPAGRRWVAPGEVRAAAETMPAVFFGGLPVAFPTLGVRLRDWPAGAVRVGLLRGGALFGPLR